MHQTVLRMLIGVAAASLVWLAGPVQALGPTAAPGEVAEELRSYNEPTQAPADQDEPPSQRPERVEPLPQEMQAISLEGQVGAQVSLDLRFVDSTGREVALRELIEPGKPVLLNLGYFRCPMLCGLVSDAVIAALKPTDYTPGDQFVMWTVSFAPNETPQLAAQYKEKYIGDLGRPEAAAGWHFLTGAQADITALTDAVGFRTTYNERTGEYGHPSAIIFLSPEGVVSGYIQDIVYEPDEVIAALKSAARGKSYERSAAEALPFVCYVYDPQDNPAINIMRVGGVLTVVALAAVLVPMWIRASLRSLHG